MHAEPSSSSPQSTPMNGHDSSLAEGGSPSLPAISPTGGRVDEVSPVSLAYPDLRSLANLFFDTQLDPLPPSQIAVQASGKCRLLVRHTASDSGLTSVHMIQEWLIIQSQSQIHKAVLLAIPNHQTLQEVHLTDRTAADRASEMPFSETKLAVFQQAARVHFLQSQSQQVLEKKVDVCR